MTRTVISAWEAVSPFGLDGAGFAEGLRAGRTCHSTATVLDHDRWPGPVERACLVPGFGAREVLGRKGTRSMDRVTALAVETTRRLLDDADGERIPGVGAQAALVLGTNTGSAQSTVDFARDSLTQPKPYFVDPAQFPHAVLNGTAARTGIWHRLQGPNTTVSGGRATGLLALNYARRLQRSGRAEAVLCGAAEEFSVARAWLETLSEPARADGALLGEGCAMVLLEPAGLPAAHRREELAELLAVRFSVCGDPDDPARVRDALASCVGRALAAGEESLSGLWAAVSSSGPDQAEDLALADILGEHAPVRLRSSELVGDTNAASAAFGLAAVLALSAQDEASHARTALVTAVDRDGMVGCALLRLAKRGRTR